MAAVGGGGERGAWAAAVDAMAWNRWSGPHPSAVLGRRLPRSIAAHIQPDSRLCAKAIKHERASTRPTWTAMWAAVDYQAKRAIEGGTPAEHKTDADLACPPGAKGNGCTRLCLRCLRCSGCGCRRCGCPTATVCPLPCRSQAGPRRWVTAQERVQREASKAGVRL